MSPRRSSRARTSGPAPQHTSSNSSHSQNRPERSTRSHNKSETSSGQRSESGDQSPNEQGDSLATRRSKRGLDIDNEDNVPTAPDDEDDEEEGEEHLPKPRTKPKSKPKPKLKQKQIHSKQGSHVGSVIKTTPVKKKVARRRRVSDASE